MTHLDLKVKKAKEIINKAHCSFSKEKVFIAWTGGKDSTVLLHIIKTVFGGHIPFPVVFNDSTMEFSEVYDFIDQIKKMWHLKLHVIQHDKKQLDTFYRSKNIKKKQELSRLMKISSIDRFLKENSVEAFIVGIRKDEHPARSKENYISSRKNHVRIHPILDFTESDIWDYIRAFKVPYVNLYDQGYRSLGEKPFTKKVGSNQKERSGREYDKEQMMDKLRNMGYW